MRDVVLTDRGLNPSDLTRRPSGRMAFVHLGSSALDPKTGEMTEADIRKQTERVLENVRGIVEAAGSKMTHVLRRRFF